jgi:hypothetical protein
MFVDGNITLFCDALRFCDKKNEQYFRKSGTDYIQYYKRSLKKREWECGMWESESVFV